MNPSDFLTVASNLYSSSYEADMRTSVGRSYYALYNLVHETLSQLGVRFNNRGEDHGLLVYYLTDCRPAGAAATVREVLKDLRTERNRADYDMTATVNNRNSEFVYKKAEASFAGFKTLNPEELKNLASCIQELPPPPWRRASRSTP